MSPDTLRIIVKEATKEAIKESARIPWGLIIPIAIAIIGAAISLGVLKQKFNQNQETLKSIGKTLEMLKNAVLKAFSYLGSTGNLPSNLAYIRSESPLSLSDAGKKMLQESGFNDIFADPINQKKMLDEVEMAKPTTRYEAEKYAEKSLLYLSEHTEMFHPMEKYAYEHGVDLLFLLKAASLVVRDKIIEDLNLTE